MVALQMSSLQATEILLQLFPAMAGHTKSRAMDALALCFSRSSLNSEVSFKRIWSFASHEIPLQLKLATLLLWAFGDSFFDNWSNDAVIDSEDVVKFLVF